VHVSPVVRSLLVVGAIVSLLVAGGRPVLARGVSCPGALAVNTTVNGLGDHASMISNSMALLIPPVKGATPARVIAYEYQTYGGWEYIQFTSRPITLSPFHGNVYDALQSALKAGAIPRSLSSPLNELQRTTQVHRVVCDRRSGGLG
jgi:hypothetical protein